MALEKVILRESVRWKSKKRKNMTRSKKIRNGRSLKTFIESKYHEAVFHEVDNLDTKCVNEARDNYEKVFIKIRNILTDKPWC